MSLHGAGKVLGLYIHYACAEAEELLITWQQVFTPNDIPDLPCDRCGKWLREDPSD